jgi:chitin disaccharide deacetylase
MGCLPNYGVTVSLSSTSLDTGPTLRTRTLATRSSLTARLGRDDSARLVIIVVDGIGSSHAATAGGYDALRRGIATSGRLMVPGPWARSAAADFRGEDIGVSLTVLAEHERFRWGPVTHAPSLVDGNGGFPSTAPDLWDHASVDEVRRECRAQLERAIWWGFDVTHLDSHLDALHMRPEFFDVELELAIEFQLPLRLPDAAAQQRAGFPFRRLAAEEGVLSPDHVVNIAEPAAAALEFAMHDLQPGVTELRLRPALDTPELRGLSSDAASSWSGPVDHHHALVLDHALHATLRAAMTRSGIELISYRELRTAQRALRSGDY